MVEKGRGAGRAVAASMDEFFLARKRRVAASPSQGTTWVEGASPDRIAAMELGA